MLPCTLLALAVHVERGLLCAIVEPILQHCHLCVAQEVLLLGQLSLGVENLQVEVAVAQSQYHVALVHARAFLYDFLSHDAAFLWRDLHDLYRQHLTVETHVVVELAASDIADGHVAPVYCHRACRASEDEPGNQSQRGHSCHGIPDVAARKFLFLNWFVHNILFLPLF